jgi:hypothetical protein
MKPANEEELNRQADELAELIDSLVAGGSGRIHLEVGDETRVRTVNSTDCSGTPGACAVPTFFDEEDEDEF